MNLLGGTHAFQCLLSVRFQIRHFAHPLTKQRAKFWTPAATIIRTDCIGSRATRGRALLSAARDHVTREQQVRVPGAPITCARVILGPRSRDLDQLARLWVAPALGPRLPDFFASSASQALMVEGSFATSGQGRPSESTAMWLSGHTGMQPGMTPRLRVVTRFFIALLPQRKSGAGWLAGGWGVARVRATERRSDGCF